MTAIREQISAYVDANAGRLVEELQRFLRQPSISTVNQGMEECVDMLREELEGLGLKTELLQVEGAFPAVFARSPKKGRRRSCSSTTTMTCRTPILWTSGRPIPLGRKSGTGMCTPGAPRTTRAISTPT